MRVQTQPPQFGAIYLRNRSYGNVFRHMTNYFDPRNGGSYVNRYECKPFTDSIGPMCVVTRATQLKDLSKSERRALRRKDGDLYQDGPAGQGLVESFLLTGEDARKMIEIERQNEKLNEKLIYKHHMPEVTSSQERQEKVMEFVRKARQLMTRYFDARREQVLREAGKPLRLEG